MNELVPLLPANHLAKIPISDKPPRLGGTVYKISPQEYKERFGCEFTEAIWGNTNDVETALKDWKAYDFIVSGGKKIIASQSFTTKVLVRLQNPFADIVISKISDSVGYGIFATKDIPRNTVIALYSGEMGPYQPKDSYAFGVDLDVNKPEWSLAVSSLKRGGIARFLQHLPKDSKKLERDLLSRLLNIDYLIKKRAIGGGLSYPRHVVEMTVVQNRKQFEQIAKETTVSEYDSEIEDCIFIPSSVRDQLAVRNVRVKKRIVQGKPLLVLVTMYAIEKGEQLGLSYRDVVSVNIRRFPEFFDMKGRIMSHSKYKRKWVQLAFKSKTPGSHFLTGRMQIASNTDIQSIVSTAPDHYSPYQIRRYLIRANVIGIEKLLPVASTTFALELIDLLNQRNIKASVQTFFRSNQLNANQPKTYVVDVVCKLKGPDKSSNYDKLTKLFAAISSSIQSHPGSYELIFKGTNITSNVFQDFIRSIINRK